ncbi:hypothetical protein CcaverHIS002_0205080 [Cutaneotrichosporon cavernicola]|uniref:Uncharacterized protein n=1 Tax=Cutaneotrichosporon cavernicola TaxID=279322 RepID=A0AA48IFF4_9TREE|nr:uncharacterized protein CcaverHIS019_0205050 [Cutaneotrichosporon cavernicola]BEI81348.1 hypothetical protein CcaverHIS002_0205080 [Cutaneotrichosporon cavernicola]BEI89143.1 hypothetical protein CcaverHIS019_0205050 [Cutaneotrichosporon cavernicola]BEI96920.1 hypothetical protein CcaverHIS631_0205090 [Cutaneotrichosporon cavernicola]BEJ04692.1 hypothetical protein CcaverHIS641_0205090 [Cutaneotrichosporon cavernicola]
MAQTMSRLDSLDPALPNPCHLFAIKQYECAIQGGAVECWPFERIFRQCGNGPALEVTNRIISDKGEHPVVDPKFIVYPPKGSRSFFDK